ncbi:sensor histidine kinase [Caloramator proteoclasticus]|uniref:histidine kinase n=1 Tax=Caloramator proteoclasticus DSM 10124 TaxID=1121262 RepID=A0A1M4Y477_9CLOT|nr:HAMP domain-containing sensor histidine kinase [Caloramator proteoclasticus]SHF00515.1 Signal transduction histidine kinase [Caloramator proteoclasticus DSM 10124]
MQKMRGSIVKKLFLINSLILVLFIILSFAFQHIFFERFYVHKRKIEAINVLSNFVETYEKTGDLKLSFEKSVDINKAFGYRFLILDKEGNVKYAVNPAVDKGAKENIRILTDAIFRISTDNLLSKVEKNKYFSVVYYNKRFPISSIITIYNSIEKNEYIVCTSLLQPINEASKVIKELYVYLFAAGIIVTLIVSLIYSKNVSRPILEIKDVADRIANLDFSKRIDIKSDDELGMLASAINTMSENLKDALNSLREANKRLEEDIEKEKKLERMRKDFIAATSHELKTPINLIQGYLEAFKDDVFDEKDKDYYIDILLDETKKMASLVNDMLDLSQLEAGKYNLVIEEFNLKDLVMRVVKKFEGSIRENKIELIMSLTDVLVKADFYRIEQVITNYLTNAIRHSTGKIEINLYKEDDLVKFEVINSGENIPEEELENIWSKFYKLDKSGNKKYGGTGLGLSIVKNIIELHGGKVGAKNIEGGVKFYFTL